MATASPLKPERWIPAIAMHLHVPPPRLPGLRLMLPALALLLSGGGLLFGLHSPHARRALTAAVPVAGAPVLAPRSLRVAAPPPAAPVTPVAPAATAPPVTTAPVQTIVRSHASIRATKTHTRRQRRAHRHGV
jgi:hypothetical protein